MLRTVGHVVSAKPGMGTPSRAGMLAASSRPKIRRARSLRSLVRVDRGVTSGAQSATTMVLVTGPQLAIAKLADKAVGGPPVTPAQRARHRQVTLAANAAVVLAGMLAQRAVIHTMPRNSRSDAARSLGQQLAMGGVAGAMVSATDLAMGERARAQLDRKGLAFTLGGLLATAQSLAVRQANRIVALDPGPTEISMPVLGPNGIQTARVPISGRHLVASR